MGLCVHDHVITCSIVAPDLPESLFLSLLGFEPCWEAPRGKKPWTASRN